MFSYPMLSICQPLTKHKRTIKKPLTNHYLGVFEVHGQWSMVNGWFMVPPATVQKSATLRQLKLHLGDRLLKDTGGPRPLKHENRRWIVKHWLGDAGWFVWFLKGWWLGWLIFMVYEGSIDRWLIFMVYVKGWCLISWTCWLRIVDSLVRAT